MILRRKFLPYLYILPAFIIYSIFVLYPLIDSLILSFYEWNGLAPRVFVGLDNYRHILTNDPIFRLSLINNMKWTIVSQLLPVNIGLIFAVVFSSKTFRRLPLFRSAIFFPTTLSMVIIALMWSWMYNPIFGLINNFLQFASRGALPTFNWFANPSTVIYYVAVAGSWGYTGVCMIMFMAALRAIPEEMFEAAAIDGANKVQQFFYISIPQIRNILNVVVVFTLINSFRVFDVVRIMTNGGPGRSTNVLATWSYTQIFSHRNIGIGSAIAWILTLLVLLFSVFYIKLNKRKED